MEQHSNPSTRHTCRGLKPSGCFGSQCLKSASLPGIPDLKTLEGGQEDEVTLLTANAPDRDLHLRFSLELRISGCGDLWRRRVHHLLHMWRLITKAMPLSQACFEKLTQPQDAPPGTRLQPPVLSTGAGMSQSLRSSWALRADGLLVLSSNEAVMVPGSRGRGPRRYF